MKIRNYSLFICLFLTSCQEKIQYVNNGATCKLTLYKDGTYNYSTPKLFSKTKESGNYKMSNEKLILESKIFYNKDSVLSIDYNCANDTPSTLKIRTLNSKDENVPTQIRLNKNDKIFTSNSKGEYSLNYSQLENDSIIGTGKNIDLFTIRLDNKEYKINMLKSYSDSRKPEELVFRLNEFVGQSFRPSIRKYEIHNDTIYIDDISRKLIGFPNFKLFKK